MHSRISWGKLVRRGLKTASNDISIFITGNLGRRYQPKSIFHHLLIMAHKHNKTQADVTVCPGSGAPGPNTGVEHYLNALFSISNAVNTAYSLDDLYQSIHKSLNTIIDATNFFIAIYDKKEDRILFPYYMDETGENFSEIKNASKSSSMSSEVIKTGKPLFFNKYKLKEHANKKNQEILGNPPEIWLGVPLKVKNTIIGAMAVQSYTDPDRYNERDKEILISVSDQVALAIERKKNQEKLKKSENRYRNLLENIDSMIFSTDVNGCFSYVSPAVKNITGYEPKKITGVFHHRIDRKNSNCNNRVDFIQDKKNSVLFSEQFIHPDDRNHFENKIKEALDSNSSYEIEYRIVKNNVKAKWIYEKGLVIENDNGQKIIEGIVYDIHDRKHAEEINQVLFSISNAVNTTFNLDDLFESIHKSLGRVIDVTNFFIALYHKEKDSLTLPYVVDEVGDILKEYNNITSSSSPSHTAIVIKTGQPVLHKKQDFLDYLKKKNLKPAMTLSEIWLGAPLKIKNEIIGVIVVHSFKHPDLYDQRDLDVLLSVSEQVALAIERKQADVQLQITQKELIEKAHLAGMSEIATGILHNVGNILNNIKVSTELIDNLNKNSKIESFTKANNLLRENFDSLDKFVSDNPKGKKLMQYYLELEDCLVDENNQIQEHINRLIKSIELITSVIVAQQSFASTSSLTEEYSFEEIIKETLTMKSDLINQNKIDVITSYASLEKIPVQKIKLMHILINIIHNARDAMFSIPRDKRKLYISLKKSNGFIQIKIKDTGEGISKKNINKIFTHGFTTKMDGRGFGLHNSANAMMEMNGKLKVESDGSDKGTTFILEFPSKVKHVKRRSNHKM